MNHQPPKIERKIITRDDTEQECASQIAIFFLAATTKNEKNHPKAFFFLVDGSLNATKNTVCQLEFPRHDCMEHAVSPLI